MTTREAALDLDANDPLGHYREEFIFTDPDTCYLDGNSLGRLPKSTAAAVNDFLLNEWGTKLVNGWADWIDQAEVVGDTIGRTAIGAKPGQVLAMDTTSVNFYRLCRAAAAARPGRSTIITDEANFPTDRYIMQGIARELGMKLVIIPNELREHTLGDPVSDERITAEILTPYLSEDVAFVTFSIVQYRSGALNPIRELTELARSYGALSVWDASHAVGVVDLQFDRDAIELAVGCTYKYGNAGPGAPAWLYVAKKLQAELDMPIYGWFGQRNQFVMGSDFDRIDGMRGFQIASPSIMGLLCVQAGFEMIGKATTAAIAKKAAVGTDMMIDLHHAWLEPLGFELVTPTDSAQRGGHISLYHPEAERISRGLRPAKNVVPDYRTPHCIRLAISPLPTSFVEVWDGFDRLRDYVESHEWQKLPLAAPKVT